jgi:hypothetical protein
MEITLDCNFLCIWYTGAGVGIMYPLAFGFHCQMGDFICLCEIARRHMPQLSHLNAIIYDTYGFIPT